MSFRPIERRTAFVLPHVLPHDLPQKGYQRVSPLKPGKYIQVLEGKR